MPLSLKSPAGGNLSLEAPATASNYTLTTPDATAFAAYGDAPTGALILPSGTTAQRSGSPSAGNTRFNSTLGVIEIYNGIDWQDITKKLPSKYRLNRSLRFRSSASAYLNRTFGTPTNNKIWTWSGWVKRGLLNSSARYVLFGTVGIDVNTQDYISFDNDNFYYNFYANPTAASIRTTQVFRDPSAWYHIVVAVDTSQATAADRFKLYVNGVPVTTFSSASYVPQNQATYINASGRQVGMGAYPPYLTNSFYDGYLTEVNFIDGQALDPSYFGEYDVFSGVWIPKAYSGTYGTNGYYLKFEDNSAATAAAIGKDSSGNGNNWTPNNISVTAGVTYDSMTDVPTLTSATASNFAALNPLKNYLNTIADGNLNITGTSPSVTTIVLATIGMSSGKWYWEFTQTSFTVNNTPMIGVAKDNVSMTAYVGSDANGWAYFGNNGQKFNNGTGAAYGASYTNNDVIGVAFDADAGTLVFYKNNTSQGTAFTGLTSGPYFPAFSDGGSTTVMTANVNFGQRPFTYTPPTGFVRLNAYNLP